MPAIRSHAASWLAALAVLAQVFLPGALAVAEARGVDVSRFTCGSSGQASAQAKAAAERIAAIIGEGLPERQAFDGHCPLCALAVGTPLPEPVKLAAHLAPTAGAGLVRHNSGLVHRPQGPPLGSRGPPPHH